MYLRVSDIFAGAVPVYLSALYNGRPEEKDAARRRRIEQIAGCDAEDGYVDLSVTISPMNSNENAAAYAPPVRVILSSI